ncbi:MAG: 16S rRNA (cytosine(1402)-N(4))-methyltransferase RsmH, partial [Desulfobacteraceae bacterium]
MTDEPKQHERRIRYSGTHPKKFNEKYKELNPEKYQDEIEKIKGRGHTPAGSHRPICVEEICEVLRLKPGMTGIDCTLGYGGHSSDILLRILPGGALIGMDVDPIEIIKTEKRIRDNGYDESVFMARHMNFSEIESCLEVYPEGFDFILADLGVSSMQLDTPDRGFSFKNPAPLDLRLNPDAGETAAQLLMTSTQAFIINILTENADEPYAKPIAKEIVSYRTHCQTTDGLAKIIINALQKNGIKADDAKPSIQRTFQALRVEVNHEFTVLDKLLQSIPRCLNPKGRVAILTFHSGEDRRVKKSFKEYEENGTFSECVRRPIRPSFEEQHDNPRSSSAKLRWA